MVLVLVGGGGAGPCECMLNSRATFSNDAQMRVGKQLLEAKEPYQKKAGRQPKQESTYSFSWGLMKGVLLLMRMMDENQSSWSQVYATAILGADETLFRTFFNGPTCMPETRGVVFSPYTHHVMGWGGGKDGQHRHIIGPSWVLHFPAGCSCIGQGLQQCTEFHIILSLGKTNKVEFFIFRTIQLLNL
jgi:hypothetical protein